MSVSKPVFTLILLGVLITFCAASTCDRDEEDFAHDSFPIPEDASVYPENTVHSLAREKSGAGCYCDHKTVCACCDNLDIPRLKLNNTGCVEVIYIPASIGMSLVLEVDNYVLLNKTLSARDPPPICYDVPDVDIVKLCVQAYDLDLHNKVFTGCARVLAEVAGFVVYKHTVGCFKIPMSPSHY